MRHHAIYGTVLASSWPFTWPLIPASPPGEVTFTCGTTAPTGVQAVCEEAAVPIIGRDAEAAPITFHPTADHDVIRFRNSADYYVWPERIHCHLADESLAYLVEIQLFGVVMALWFERQQVATLHASVVVIDGRGVAFLGRAGGGKTTAATSLIAAGHELLVDDMVATRIARDEVFVQPGYPMLRLWPEQVDHFVGDREGLQKVHPDYAKLLVPLGPRFGPFRATEAPLARIYLPQRQRPDTEVTIDPVASQDAFMTLVANSFLHEAVHGLGLAPARLPALSLILSHTCVNHLRYPDGFDRLPNLEEAILADLADDASP